LPGKSHGQRSLLGYSPWGHKRVGHNVVTKQQQKSVSLQGNNVKTRNVGKREEERRVSEATFLGISLTWYLEVI